MIFFYYGYDIYIIINIFVNFKSNVLIFVFIKPCKFYNSSIFSLYIYVCVLILLFYYFLGHNLLTNLVKSKKNESSIAYSAVIV
jgi:hypothetical protein